MNTLLIIAYFFQRSQSSMKHQGIWPQELALYMLMLWTNTSATSMMA